MTSVTGARNVSADAAMIVAQPQPPHPRRSCGDVTQRTVEKIGWRDLATFRVLS